VPDPYTEAQKANGKHHGFYRQFASASIIQIWKSIRSLEELITLHKDKIAQPEKYIPDFNTLDARRQKALVQSLWPQEIARFQEQVAILQGILRDRETNAEDQQTERPQEE